YFPVNGAVYPFVASHKSRLRRIYDRVYPDRSVPAPWNSPQRHLITDIALYHMEHTSDLSVFFFFRLLYQITFLYCFHISILIYIRVSADLFSHLIRMFFTVKYPLFSTSS